MLDSFFAEARRSPTSLRGRLNMNGPVVWVSCSTGKSYSEMVDSLSEQISSKRLKSSMVAFAQLSGSVFGGVMIVTIAAMTLP